MDRRTAGDRIKRRLTTTRVVRFGNREIIAKGFHQRWSFDFYHQAMTIRWPSFFFGTLVVFAGFNAIFAALYAMFPGSIANVPPDRPWHVLFFSIETLATVGYGDMHPQTEWAHWIASIETFFGVTLSAVLTGLIFARFSRPRARLLFSDRILISQHEGEPHLKIRLANARLNMISDALAKLWMLSTVHSAEGKVFRRFHELKLERIENPTFVLSWTLFHRIDETSPLFDMGLADFEAVEAEFIISVRGNDESVAQEMRARHRYTWRDIVFGAQFADLLGNDSEGRLVLDYSRFHLIEMDEAVQDA